MFLSFQTDRPSKQCRPRGAVLEEHSDQGLQCFPFCMHLLDALLYGKATLFKFYGDYSKFFVCPKLQEFYSNTVITDPVNFNKNLESLTFIQILKKYKNAVTLAEHMYCNYVFGQTRLGKQCRSRSDCSFMSGQDSHRLPFSVLDALSVWYNHIVQILG